MGYGGVDRENIGAARWSAWHHESWYKTRRHVPEAYSADSKRRKLNDEGMGLGHDGKGTQV